MRLGFMNSLMFTSTGLKEILVLAFHLAVIKLKSIIMLIFFI